MPFYTQYLSSENEPTLFFLRRHVFTFVKTFVFHILLALLPVIMIFVFFDGLNSYWNHPVIGVAMRLGLSVYYLSMVLFIFHSFIDYYLDIWIITPERIVNIEQEGLFAREVSELKLLNIQDVTSDVRGLFPTMFGYGNVTVQTAAEKGHFHLKEIPEPYRVAKEIMRLRDTCKTSHNHSEEPV